MSYGGSPLASQSKSGFSAAAKRRIAKGDPALVRSWEAAQGWCDNPECALSWAEHTVRQRRACKAARG